MMNSSIIQNSNSKHSGPRSSVRFGKALGCAVLGLILTHAVAVEAVPTAKADRNAAAFPPQSTPYDTTFSQWAGALWRWAYSFPLGQNPIEDTTGQFAALGQSRPVWFLSGSSGTSGQPVTRTIMVPSGKSLFFPIIDAIWINIPVLGDNPWSPEQREFAFSIISPLIDNAYGLSCDVDGKPVRNLPAYRTMTPPEDEYEVTLPENNVLGVPISGTFGPTVDDGIYLMLPPLSVGTHTLRFTASSQGSVFGAFHLDVTYHITVANP